MFLVYLSISVAQPQQKKHTDLILTHLTVTNTVTLLTRGVPEMMVVFGMKNILDDVGCKVIVYVRRVARDLSICSTCLLSVFQAVTISPGTSWLSRFKPRAPHYILPSFFFFWLLNMLISINIIESAKAVRNGSNTENTYITKYCSTIPKSSDVTVTLTLTCMTFRDLVFVFLMSWASGYMVFVLHRHQGRVRHIHGTGRSPKSSTETRAIHTILLLVGCFVSFYCINGLITLHLSFLKDHDTELQSVMNFLSTCFPSLSPLVLICRDPRFPWPQCVLEMTSCFGPSVEHRDQRIATRTFSVSKFPQENVCLRA
ncbi:vomeronasal 1 receptor ornAnaV1R3006 [Ornithorhynchus anatinus]|nr:vomeronasal 1 receptor ornAnaV1R3006 [Ornithorhynchus anatinus]